MSGIGKKPDRRGGVTRRALAVGFLLVPINALFLIRLSYAWGGTAGGVLFHNTVSLLLVLALVNRGLRRWRPGWAFAPGELLTIYCILAVSTSMIGGPWSVGGTLPAIMTYAFRFATPENGWRELIWPCFPTWLTIQDPSLLEGFWIGDSSAYSRDVMRAWAVPAFWWTSFMGAVMWVCLCLNSVVRRRWAEEERLSFPFTVLPVQVVEERFGLFRNKLWWMGLSFSFLLGMWNAVVGLLPALPAIPLNFNFQPYLINHPPWEAILYRCQYVSWQPSWIGLCYLMPLDLLFSLLVFELAWLGEYVLSWHFGWATASGFPYIDHQNAGALVGLAIAFLWLDRRYLLEVGRRVLGLRSSLGDEQREALGYRTAVVGALLGFAYVWWFWARTGVPGWIVLVFFALYFAVAMMVSRIRAQVGSPVHELYGVMPDVVLRTAVGTSALGNRTVGMFTLLSHYLTGDQENSPVPIQLETLKMAEEGRMERRRIAVAIALVVPLTVALYFWGYAHFGYQLGIGTPNTERTHIWVSRAVIEMMDSTLRQPREMDSGATMAMGFGGGFTILLLALKLRFPWWPLHPIALSIANSWMMHYLTVVFVVAWGVKALLLRYGGLRMHRAALPLFLGLFVGELCSFFVGSLAAVLFGYGT